MGVCLFIMGMAIEYMKIFLKFETDEHLFRHISNMTLEEYRERMNRCIEVFNKIIETRKRFDPYREVVLENIIKKIYSIMKIPYTTPAKKIDQQSRI
jgi:hypothetical protein